MTARVSDILPAAAPHASRPVAPTTIPTLFSCADHRVIYRWDGATWETWLDVSTLLAAIDLDALADVDTTTAAPTDGQALIYDATATEWVPGDVSSALDDLTDVDTTTSPPADGDNLTFDTTTGTWLPAAPASAPSTLDDLTDVNVAGATTGQVLALGGGGSWGPVTPSSGGGATSTATDPRSLYRDDCAGAALPAGASSSGGVTFDATDFERVLTGAATYTTPAAALRGTLVFELELTQRLNYANASLQMRVKKGSTTVAWIDFASDSNIVAYNSANTAVGNIATGGTSAGFTDGTAVRAALSIDKSGLCTATISAITGGDGTSNPNGQQAWGVQTLKWASGLAGLAAGDNLTVEISQAGTTRVVGIARVLVTRGGRALGAPAVAGVPMVLLNAGQNAGNIPAGTPAGAIIFRKA